MLDKLETDPRQISEGTRPVFYQLSLIFEEGPTPRSNRDRLHLR